MCAATQTSAHSAPRCVCVGGERRKLLRSTIIITNERGSLAFVVVASVVPMAMWFKNIFGVPEAQSYSKTQLLFSMDETG